MGKIITLDECLSNKIAAGEVVERPSSIVKELVENSIDASSTSISIEVEEGGLGLIRIVDNGEGMDREDSLLAFDRHATSKIKTANDLFRIKTLGFRGEALPSIASVSHLQLKTCTKDGQGTITVVHGGKIIEHGAAPSRKGTDITITNLFFNTPARLKYLKTIHTELGHITDFVYRLALAHPSISFRLSHNGKKIFSTNGNGDSKQVLAAIYGISIAKQLLPFSNSSLDFKISGYVCKPEVTRASRSYISIFVNDRYIKNYPITNAILQGYHTLLPIGRYPIVVLHVEMDPILIDVNVHPAKLEVRLSKEEELTKLVSSTIKNVFQKVQLIPEVKKTTTKKPIEQQLSLKIEHSELKEQKAIVKEEQSHIQQYNENKPVKNDLPTTKIVEEQTFIDPPILDRVPVLYPIGQMHGTYILAQNDRGLYIVDQHAAQERINYEYYREKVGQVQKQLQELLVPITFECSHAEMERLKEYDENLQELGIFLEPFGPQSFICRAHPTWFPKGFEEEIVKEMIEKVLAGNSITVKSFREEAAILMSCKAAIKANRHLRNDEIFTLLETLRKCENPFTCPHGRPIFNHFSTYEMEKMFKRIM